MQRLNQYVLSLLAATSLATACQRNTETQSEPPSDAAMGQTQPTSMPNDQTGMDATATQPDEGAEPGGMGGGEEPAAAKTLAEVDRRFVETAAVEGMAEVELGRLAVEKAKKPQVKDFAQKMIDDHGKANEELMSLARTKGIEVPTELPPEKTDKRAELEKLSGAKFEKQYVTMMVADHEKAVSLFREQSQNGEDPELKSWAGKTLPKLEEHLAHAQAMKAGKAYKPKSDAQASAHGSHGGATASAK